MKLDLNKDINDFQDAQRLKIILEHYSHSDGVDNNTLLFVQTILSQLDEFISDPQFKHFNHSSDIAESALPDDQNSMSLYGRIYSWWRKLTGPTRRELILSKQRHELIERAERAEAIAFEAIAETAEIGRQRDEIMKKLQQINKDG